ncbi:hypothetical protein ABT160_24875 [Streptomyces sp. NPDC001941]|uniref:hypothetical protein n=1 Tax=Streptomyces sp. NPDC001941 TaxID=3154659 RepID=UPI003326F287
MIANRRRGAHGQLLLVLVLALGVFLMHTMGHPDPDAASGSGTSSVGVAAVPMGSADMGSADMGPVHMGPAHMAPASTGPVHMGPDAMGPAHMGPVHMGPDAMGPDHTAPVHMDPGHTAPDHASAPSGASHHPMSGMDMTSLCVAVLLAAWVLLALVRAARARHSGRLLRVPAVPASTAPAPAPARPPELSRLSVLRI